MRSRIDFCRAPLHRGRAAAQSSRCSCRACRRSFCRDGSGGAPDRVSCNPGVVHPAEVPFEPETEAAAGWRTVTPAKSVDSSAMVTAPGVCSPRMRLVLRRNSMASRFSRPPYSLGSTPRLAAIVAIDHRGHCVDAQSIDAEAFDPVQRISHREVADFAASVVVDQGIPVW